MKSVRIIILFLLCFSSCNGQTKSPDLSKVVKEQAEKMAHFLIEKDFDSFNNYTYPKIIEMMGGKKAMVEVMERGSKEMESEGTKILKVTLGEPSKILTENKELQCTLSQEIEMKVSNGRLVSKSTLIAISTDNGEKWYFMDASGKDILTMKSMLPNLSAELIIPKQSTPVFYKD